MTAFDFIALAGWSYISLVVMLVVAWLGVLGWLAHAWRADHRLKREEIPWRQQFGPIKISGTPKLVGDVYSEEWNGLGHGLYVPRPRPYDWQSE